MDECRAGADYAITQMFFDVDTYLPAFPRPRGGRGMSDAGHPGDHAGHHDPLAAPHPQPQHRRLIGEEAPGLHFMTMDFSQATTEIYRNLGPQV